MALTDAGFSSTVVIQHRKPISLGRNNSAQNREVLTYLSNALADSNGGVDALHGNFNQATTGSKAGATLIVSGGTGTIGGIINGVTVTGSGAGTDTQDAAVIAAAINASSNALVSGFVRAASSYATLTLSSTAAGSTVTIRIGSAGRASSYTFTATAAATGRLGEFSISGSDTADATALCDAINAYPVLNQSVRAENVAGVAYIYAMDDVITDKAVSVSGITLTAAFAAATRVHIECLIPGAIGNAITIALSGTGITVANANSRFVGGTGGVTGTTKRANALGV